jgi:hypothetical protein
MRSFSVTVQNVPHRDLGPLLTQLARAGFDSPIIESLGAVGSIFEIEQRMLADALLSAARRRGGASSTNTKAKRAARKRSTTP